MSKHVYGVPRIALTRLEAAAALGMSLDSFERHVQSDVRLIRRGKLRLVPVAELQAWAERNAERVLDSPAASQTTHNSHTARLS